MPRHTFIRLQLPPRRRPRLVAAVHADAIIYAIRHTREGYQYRRRRLKKQHTTYRTADMKLKRHGAHTPRTFNATRDESFHRFCRHFRGRQRRAPTPSTTAITPPSNGNPHTQQCKRTPKGEWRSRMPRGKANGIEGISGNSGTGSVQKSA